MTRAQRILEAVAKRLAKPHEPPKRGEHGTTLRDKPKPIEFEKYNPPVKKLKRF